MIWVFKVLIPMSFTCSIASVLATYPHHLAYFNEISGGAVSGYKHLLGSNVDWGQDRLQCLEFLRSFGFEAEGADTESILHGYLYIREARSKYKEAVEHRMSVYSVNIFHSHRQSSRVNVAFDSASPFPTAVFHLTRSEE